MDTAAAARCNRARKHRGTLMRPDSAHQHPHDQMAYVISGHERVRAGDETFEARAGDSFVIRGGVEHQAWALESSVVIDVFTPCREDYL